MFSINDAVAFDRALATRHEDIPEGSNPLFVKCPHCGKRLDVDSQGVVSVYDTPDGYVHEDCFTDYMNGKYGEGNWWEVPDDGCDGYYMYRDKFGYAEGTGIYWTQFEGCDLDMLVDEDAL